MNGNGVSPEEGARSASETDVTVSVSSSRAPLGGRMSPEPRATPLGALLRGSAYDQVRAATLSTGPGTKIGCVQCPVRGGGRESNPPSSFRRITGFEGMSSLPASDGSLTRAFVFRRRPRTHEDL